MCWCRWEAVEKMVVFGRDYQLPRFDTLFLVIVFAQICLKLTNNQIQKLVIGCVFFNSSHLVITLGENNQRAATSKKPFLNEKYCMHTIQSIIEMIQHLKIRGLTLLSSQHDKQSKT